MKNKFFEDGGIKGEFKPLMPKYYPYKYKKYVLRESSFIRAKVTGAGRVLEAGVGTGRLIPILAPIVKEVVGVDNSQFMLGQSRQMAANFRNVKILEGNLEELCVIFPKDYFDFALCTWNTLGNVNDEVAVLREISKVAKNGVIATVFLKGTLEERKGWYKSVGVSLFGIDEKNETCYTESGLVSRAYSETDLKKLAASAYLKAENFKVLCGVVLWAEFSRK